MDGRYYVSLWMVLHVIVFLLPMPRRSHWKSRLAAGACVLLITGRYLLMLQSYVISIPLVIRLLMGAAATVFILWCSPTSPRQAAYATVWSMMTHQTSQNMVGVLMNFLWRLDYEPLYGITFLCWEIVSIPLCYFFLAKTLFKRQYNISRYHLEIVAVLFVEFELVQGVPDIKVIRNGLGQNYQFVLMNSICLLVALYLVHTLFAKKRAEDQLAIANALQQSQRMQYESAKRNIALINRHCHALRMQLADLKAVHNADEQQQRLQCLSDAIDGYDSQFSTGNETLDLVLSEQQVFCAERNINLHCMADGTLLSFMENADLYTLCTSMMKNIIPWIGNFADPEQRQLDITLYSRQGMIVLEMAGMLPEKAETALPKEPAGLDNILEKYSAVLFIREEYACGVMRCLIPQKEK